jgi:hypothetical protein
MFQLLVHVTQEHNKQNMFQLLVHVTQAHNKQNMFQLLRHVTESVTAMVKNYPEVNS